MSGNLGSTYESFLARCIDAARKEREAFRELAEAQKRLGFLGTRERELHIPAGGAGEKAEELTEAYRKRMEAFEKEGDVYSVLPPLRDLVRHREEAIKTRGEELQRQEEERRRKREQEEEAARRRRAQEMEDAQRKRQQEEEARRRQLMLKSAAALEAAAKVAATEAEKKENERRRKFFLSLGLHLLCVAVLLFIPILGWAGLFFYGMIMLEGRDKKRRNRKMEKTAYLTNLALPNLVAEMVPIPGKTFMMGKHEVTQAQWEALMSENPATFKGADNPVETVSWNDCQEFLKTLNALPAVKESGLVFRLPTKEEWIFACLAGSTGDYCRLSDGTEITEDTFGQVAWFRDNSDKKTHPVGHKQPNAFGLYDMHGNVCEMVVTKRLNKEDCNACGGAFDTKAKHCCCRSLNGFTPLSGHFNNLGFRLVSSLAE